MKNELFIKSRIWIASREGTYLGDGKVRLLQAIQENGSITAAAKSIGISYRKAWKMIDVMNAQSKLNLVERQSGGKKGGGTKLTPHGVKAIESFLDLQERCNAFVDEEFKKMDF